MQRQNKGFGDLCVNQSTFQKCIVLYKEVKINTLLKSVLFYTRKSKSIHFLLIHITNPYVFLSLLATTGAASVPQYRLFSFEFFEKVYCFIQAKKIAMVK